MQFWRVLGISISVGSLLNAAEPTLSEKMFELEAEVSSLKEEVESTKALASQERANAFNPSISVVVDVLGKYATGIDEHEEEEDHHDDDHDHSWQNGVLLRETELEFRADVDPYADAAVVLAIEQKNDFTFSLHVEEAYARFKQWPGLGGSPLGIEMTVGQFRGAFGRINRIHQHNIPQITYPMAMRSFLGNEGFFAQGVSLNTSFATSAKSALTLFLEGSNGGNTPMQKEGANRTPNGLAHAWFHQELSSAHYLDIGLSSMLGSKGKKDAGTFLLIGADIHYSYQPAGYGQNPLFLFGTEFFAANTNKQPEHHWPMGNFTWAQVRLVGSTFLGARYDVAPKAHERHKFQHALSGYLSYYTTEFLRLRFGYEHAMPEMNSFKGDHRFMLSMIFVLGSHPVEPYFVNR